MKRPLSQMFVNFTLKLQEKVIYALKGKKHRTSGPEVENVSLSGDFIDLESAQALDRGSSVKYNTTENSKFAKGAAKAPAFGIDKFGEKDTFNPEKENKKPNENSDLSQRYYTHGMDIKNKDLERH